MSIRKSVVSGSFYPDNKKTSRKAKLIKSLNGDLTIPKEYISSYHIPNFVNPI